MTRDTYQQARQEWKDNMIKAIVNDDLATAAALIQERPYWGTMEYIIDMQESRRSMADRILALEKILGKTSGENGKPLRLPNMEEMIEELNQGLNKAFQGIEELEKLRSLEKHFSDDSEVPR